jgi:hypothetical protein
VCLAGLDARREEAFRVFAVAGDMAGIAGGSVWAPRGALSNANLCNESRIG